MLIFIGASSHAQDYLGNWSFAKVIKSKASKIMLEDDMIAMNQVFKSYYIELRADSTYSATMLSVAQDGNYRFQNDTITLDNKDKFTLMKTRSAVLSTRDFDLMFKRQDGLSPQKEYSFLITDRCEKIKFSKDLILGRWVAREVKVSPDNENPELTETLLSSLVLTLLADGRMDFNIFGIQDVKLWGIDDTRTELILGADEITPEIYNVCKLNETQMILKLTTKGTLIYLIKEVDERN